MRWKACVHRLDLGLYSHPKEFLGNEVRTHVNSKENSPLPGKTSPQRRIEPTTLHQAGKRAQHTTNELFRPPQWMIHAALTSSSSSHARRRFVSSSRKWLPSSAPRVAIVISAFKGAIRDLKKKSPHCAANRLQHVRSSGPGENRVQITCGISSAYHVQHIVFRATWYGGTAQLLNLTEC